MFVTLWVKLKNIFVHKSETLRQMLHDITYLWNQEFREAENQILVSKRLGESMTEKILVNNTKFQVD